MSVYFVRAGAEGLVKIGYAANPIARISGLQTGQSQPLRIIRLTTGERSVEAAFHRLFREHRVRGEWFNFDATMLTSVVDGATDLEIPRRVYDAREGRPKKAASDMNIDLAIYNIQLFLWEEEITAEQLALRAGVEVALLLDVADPDWNPTANTLRVVGRYITRKWKERRAVREATDRAIKAIGGPKKAAEVLGMPRKWADSLAFIPRQHVATIASLSGVAANDLRPDLFVTDKPERAA